MPSEPFVQTKPFSSLFILDSTKLKELVTAIQKNFSSTTSPVLRFEILLSDNRKFSGSTIDFLLEHENSVKNPIIELDIVVSDTFEHPNKSCNVNFNRDNSKILLKVKSSEKGWLNSIFPDIENQIARTFFGDLPLESAKSKFFLFNFAFLVMISILFGQILKTQELKLTNEDMAQITKLGQEAKTDAEKIESLFQIQNRHLINSNNVLAFVSKQFFSISWKSILIILPLILVFLYFLYLRSWFPGSLFLWGDQREFLERKKAQRDTISNWLFGGLFINIVAGLYIIAIS